MRVKIFKRVLLAFEIGAIIAILYVGARLWRVQARLQRDLERAQAAEAAITREEGSRAAAPRLMDRPLRKLVLPTINLETDLTAAASSTVATVPDGPVLISAIQGEPADFVPFETGDEKKNGALFAAARLGHGDPILLVEGESTQRFTVTASRPAMASEVLALTRTSRADLALIVPEDTSSDTKRRVILATLDRDGAN